jgi:hypothetical protein
MIGMLNKDNEIKWDDIAKEPFAIINKYLGESPMFINHDYNKDFMIFPFASTHTIHIVSLQKNDQGDEQPISFYYQGP